MFEDSPNNFASPWGEEDRWCARLRDGGWKLTTESTQDPDPLPGLRKVNGSLRAADCHLGEELGAARLGGDWWIEQGEILIAKNRLCRSEEVPWKEVAGQD